jgi:hypothetical protein
MYRGQSLAMKVITFVFTVLQNLMCVHFGNDRLRCKTALGCRAGGTQL